MLELSANATAPAATANATGNATGNATAAPKKKHMLSEDSGAIWAGLGFGLFILGGGVLFAWYKSPSKDEKEGGDYDDQYNKFVSEELSAWTINW